jgi:hypothetical protein
MTQFEENSGANGGVRKLLRTEGLALLIVAAWAFSRVSGDWRLFLALFLVPDASFAFYLFGPRVGAIAYNAMHATLGPLLLAGASLALQQPVALPVALIWLAHIGLDRALGYGLKYTSSFGDTHLGRIGRKASRLSHAQV